MLLQQQCYLETFVIQSRGLPKQSLLRAGLILISKEGINGIGAQAEGQSEAVPVAFRWDIAAVDSKRTNVFKANPLSGSSEFKGNSLGAVYCGKWADLPENNMVDVLWEDSAGQF